MVEGNANIRSVHRGDGRWAIVSIVGVWMLLTIAFALRSELAVLDHLFEYVKEYGRANAGSRFALWVEIYGGLVFMVLLPGAAATVAAFVGLRRRPTDFSWVNILRVATLLIVPASSAIVYWVVTSRLRWILDYSVQHS